MVHTKTKYFQPCGSHVGQNSTETSLQSCDRLLNYFRCVALAQARRGSWRVKGRVRMFWEELSCRHEGCVKKKKAEALPWDIGATVSLHHRCPSKDLPSLVSFQRPGRMWLEGTDSDAHHETSVSYHSRGIQVTCRCFRSWWWSWSWSWPSSSCSWLLRMIYFVGYSVEEAMLLVRLSLSIIAIHSPYFRSIQLHMCQLVCVRQIGTFFHNEQFPQDPGSFSNKMVITNLLLYYMSKQKSLDWKYKRGKIAHTGITYKMEIKSRNIRVETITTSKLQDCTSV